MTKPKKNTQNNPRTKQFGPLQMPWVQQNPEGSSALKPSESSAAYVTVPPDTTLENFPQIDPKYFEIPPNGMTDAQRTAAVDQLKKVLKTQHANFMGFQANQDEKYSDYAWLLDM